MPNIINSNITLLRFSGKQLNRFDKFQYRDRLDLGTRGQSRKQKLVIKMLKIL